MKIKGLVMTAAFCVAFSSTVYAGQWKQESDGRWWYQNDDGNFTKNGWQNIEGKDYYFNGDGYLLINTTTPDGYQVGADGAWINPSSGVPSAAAASPLFDLDLTDCRVTYDGWKVIDDYEGNDALGLYWTYTNKSNEAKGPWLGYYSITCFQNGVELGHSYISSYENIRDEEFDNYSKSVLPGTSIKAAKAFKLADHSPVTVQVKELWNWKNAAVQTATININ